MGLFGKNGQVSQDEVTFQRHVALDGNGLGATFKRVTDRQGNTQWTWSYDSGLRDDFVTMMATERALTLMEKELGLPLTWPHLDPDAPRPKYVEPTPEERRMKLHEQLAKDPKDFIAQSQLWTLDGSTIGPDDLIPGTIYSISFDLGIFLRSFVGLQWEGYPEFADNPGAHGEWFEFDNSQSKGGGGARIDREDWIVRQLPVGQDEARQVFDELRAGFLRRKAQEGEPRHH